MKIEAVYSQAMKTMLMAIAVLAAGVSSAAAQSPCTPAPPLPTPLPTAYSCPAGTQFPIEFDTSTDATKPSQVGDVFKVRVSGAQVGTDLPFFAGQVSIRVVLAGFPAGGPLPIAVGVVRPGFPESISAPITVTFTPPPPAPPAPPGGLRIVAEVLDDHGGVIARIPLLERLTLPVQ